MSFLLNGADPNDADRRVGSAGVSSPRLSETSYIVLGLLERLQPATPYDLKQLAQLTTSTSGACPTRSSTPSAARLAEAGLLTRSASRRGRRRRIYRLTARGAGARGAGVRTPPRGDLRAARRRHPEAVLRGRAADRWREPAGGPPKRLERARGAAGELDRREPRGLAAGARAGHRPRSASSSASGRDPGARACGGPDAAGGRDPDGGHLSEQVLGQRAQERRGPRSVARR